MGRAYSAGGMELRSLSYFVRIAELGSITRAAAHLRVAQPALTRQVQRLEEELGAALFTRVNRGVRLTEAGQRLLDSATRILRDVERTSDEIRAHDAFPSGKIILGITPTLCPVLVPDLFARMRAAVSQDRAEGRACRHGAAGGDADRRPHRPGAAVGTVAQPADRLDAAGGGGDGAGDAAGARAPGVVTAAELRRTNLILGDGLRAAMDALLAGLGIELKVEIELNDHETIRRMVQQGVGASILPHASVAGECARGLAEAHRLTASGIFRTLALGLPPTAPVRSRARQWRRR